MICVELAVFEGFQLVFMKAANFHTKSTAFHENHQLSYENCCFSQKLLIFIWKLPIFIWKPAKWGLGLSPSIGLLLLKRKANKTMVFWTATFLDYHHIWVFRKFKCLKYISKYLNFILECVKSILRTFWTEFWLPSIKSKRFSKICLICQILFRTVSWM